MKIVFKLNKYNYIENYNTILSSCNNDWICAEFIEDIKSINEYQYLDGVFIHNKPTEKPYGLNLIYDGHKWIELSTQEQIKIEIIRLEDLIMDLKVNINFRISEGYFIEEKQAELKNLENKRRKLLDKLQIP